MAKSSFSQARLNEILSVVLGVTEDEAGDILAKRLANVDQEVLTSFLTLLGNYAGISAEQYKKAVHDLQVAEWEDVAGKYGVPMSFEDLDHALDYHSLTACYLPASFISHPSNLPGAHSMFSENRWIRKARPSESEH